MVFLYVMFICIFYKFNSRVIFFSSLVSSVFGLFQSLGSFLVGWSVGHIRLVSIFVAFALPLFCILHVRSLLVYVHFRVCHFVIFSYRVHFMFGLNLDTCKGVCDNIRKRRIGFVVWSIDDVFRRWGC